MIPKPIRAADTQSRDDATSPARPAGQAPDRPRRAAPSPPPGAVAYLRVGAERACRILVFLVLILIPCLYPLQLPKEWAVALGVANPDSQFYAFLNFLYHPLHLKEGAFSVLVVVLVLCWLVRELARAAGGGGIESSGRRFDWAVSGPVLALLLWSAITLLYAPTFYWSITTYSLLVVGVLWFVVVYQMPKDARLVRRGFNTILLAGGIVAFFAFLQHVDRHRVITGKLFVDIRAAAERGDPTVLRLRMGSLIGHNIGVGSMLGFCWFIVLSRLFQPSSWTRKGLWGAWLLFLFFVILAAQTRGIWIVLAILTPCHLVWLMRLTGKRFDLKPVLAVVLVALILVTLQSVRSPSNPFFAPESPLPERFKHFTPSHLLTETRLRIAVCSGSLLAARPFRGHGLGAFQYVYPGAQAEYFRKHPDSILAPSPNRTMQAHNDWLQVLVELGLPGLLIVLAGLYILLRRGMTGWETIGDPALRLEMTAALMAVAGEMIHGLGNFPIHVVSTAVPFIFFLAVWVGCGRMGRLETGNGRWETAEGERRAVGAGKSAREGGGKPAAGKAPKAGLPQRVIAVAGLLVAFSLAVGGAGWFYSHLHGSMYETIGTAHRIYYGDHAPEMTDPERRRELEIAYWWLREGHKRLPLSGEIVFRMGEVSALYGVAAAEEALKVVDDGSVQTRTVKLGRVRDAQAHLERAVNWLRDCRDEVLYHEVFHYLGLCHEYFYRLYGGEADRQTAKQYYRRAVHYSPCFSRSLMGLFRLLEQDKPPNPAELREVYRAIARYDPLLFYRNFTQQIWDAIDRRDCAKAVEMIDTLIDVQPENVDLWLKKAHLLAQTGHGVEADMLLDRIAVLFKELTPPQLLGYRMGAAVASNRLADALALATAALSFPGNEGVAPYNRVVQAAVLEKLKRPEAQEEWAEIERLNDPRYIFAAVDVYYFLLRDPESAFPWLMKACSSEPPAPPAFFRMAAEMLYKRGEKARALEFLEKALERDPEDPLARKLLEEFQP